MTYTPEHRAWCFVFQYPGKIPAVAGTVFMRPDAKHHEIEAECKTFWARIFPFEAPPIVQLVPGMLIMQEENDA